MRPPKRVRTERIILTGAAVILACGAIAVAVRMSKAPPPRARPTLDDLLNSGRDIPGAMNAIGSSDPAAIADALETLSSSLMDDTKCEAVIRTANLSAMTDTGWSAFQAFVRKNWLSCRDPMRKRLERELSSDHRAGSLDGILPKLTRVAELGPASDGNRDYSWPTSVPRAHVEQVITSLAKR